MAGKSMKFDFARGRQLSGKSRTFTCTMVALNVIGKSGN